MTQEFISTVIGNSFDQWITLEKQVQRISFLSDSIITIDPKYRLFYFDTKCKMMHVLNLTGDLKKTSLIEPIPEGWIRVEINGILYLNKIAKFAIPYQFNQEGMINYIHKSISFDKIVGFYKELKVSLEDIMTM